MNGLSRRVERLERVLSPGPAACRSCGLRHVRPLTLAVVRGILRIEGGSGQPLAPHQALCLCDPCCGDTGDRWFAQLSHGLLRDEGVA